MIYEVQLKAHGNCVSSVLLGPVRTKLHPVPSQVVGSDCRCEQLQSMA